MTEGEAVDIARRVAAERGWVWLDPPVADYRKPLFRKTGLWEILSNGARRGTNVRVLIDDASGEVLEAGYVAL